MTLDPTTVTLADLHASHPEGSTRVAKGSAVQPVRAEGACMYGATNPATPSANDSECRPVRAAEATNPAPARSAERGPLAPGGPARTAAADLFDALLTERWKRGDDSVSNRALAERHLKVDEKQLRQYRDGRKALPLAALLVLPVPLVEEIVARVLTERGGAITGRRPVVQLHEALAAIDPTKIPADDRREVLNALLDAQGRIGDLVRALMKTTLDR